MTNFFPVNKVDAKIYKFFISHFEYQYSVLSVCYQMFMCVACTCKNICMQTFTLLQTWPVSQSFTQLNPHSTHIRKYFNVNL